MTHVARLVNRFNAFNAVNEITVELYFQKFPGVPHGDDRGIRDLEYTVTTPAGELIQQGKTPSDGKIRLRIRGGISVLKLMRGDTKLATYEVSATNAAFSADATREGQKERLRMLGYQIGHGGIDHDGVDAADNYEFERSLLDFQVEIGVVADARPEAAVRNRLASDAGS